MIDDTTAVVVDLCKRLQHLYDGIKLLESGQTQLHLNIQLVCHHR